jgi:hypothetical protein
VQEAKYLGLAQELTFDALCKRAFERQENHIHVGHLNGWNSKSISSANYSADALLLNGTIQ